MHWCLLCGLGLGQSLLLHQQSIHLYITPEMKTSAEPFAVLFPGWPVDIEKKRLETISRYQTETRWNKMVRDLEIKRLKRRCSAIDTRCRNGLRLKLVFFFSIVILNLIKRSTLKQFLIHVRLFLWIYQGNINCRLYSLWGVGKFNMADVRIHFSCKTLLQKRRTG